MEQRSHQHPPLHTFNKPREDVRAPFLNPYDVRVQSTTSPPSRHYDCLQNHYSQKQLHRYKNIFSQRPRTTTPRMYHGFQPNSFSTNSISSNEQEYFFDEIEDINDSQPVYFNENEVIYTKNPIRAPDTAKTSINSAMLQDVSLSMPENQSDWIPESQDPTFGPEDIKHAPMKFADEDSEHTTSVSTSPPPLSSIDYSNSNDAINNTNEHKSFAVHQGLDCSEDENRKYIPILFKKCST